MHQLISQTFCAQPLVLATGNVLRSQYHASTTAPRSSHPQKAQQSSKKSPPPPPLPPPPPPPPDTRSLTQRIQSLLSAPTNNRTKEELAELRSIPLPRPKLVCLLAEALAYHAFVPDALDLIARSRSQGMDIPPALCEPIAFHLARKHRWADILALLEPFQSLVPNVRFKSKTSEKHRVTTRLCEWRVRACAELGDYAGMERALGMFPHEIPRRAWEIARVAFLRNSDPQIALKIDEALMNDRFLQEKEGSGPIRGNRQPKSVLEKIARALIGRQDPQDGTSETISIERAPQADGSTLPTYSISVQPSSPDTPSLGRALVPDSRLAIFCVRALVQDERVTEAATMVASMCKGIPLPDSRLPPIPQASTSDPTPVTLSDIFAPVRPDVLVFNALLKGVLDTRGLGGMLTLLEIMQDSDIKPNAETAALLLRYLDRQCAWNPGRLVDTLVDLTTPIPKDHSNDPALPPKVRPVPVSIRHTNVLLDSILHAERKSTLGGGWKASAAFLKYHSRPADRLPASDARVESTPDNVDPPTAGMEFMARADSLNPILDALRARGVRNDSMTYAIRAQRDGVIRLDPEAARRVLQMSDIPLGPYHYAALMNGLVECGYMDAATAVMDAAHKSGVGADSPVMHTILVSGYSRMGLPEKAAQAFERMIEVGIKPDSIAVDALASAWFIAGEYHRAREVALKYWPGEGEYPFAKDAGLKEIIWKLRKLRPTAKVRQKRFEPVPQDEKMDVVQIIKTIKAPDKVLPTKDKNRRPKQRQPPAGTGCREQRNNGKRQAASSK